MKNKISKIATAITMTTVSATIHAASIETTNIEATDNINIMLNINPGQSMRLDNDNGQINMHLTLATNMSDVSMAATSTTTDIHLEEGAGFIDLKAVANTPGGPVTYIAQAANNQTAVTQLEFDSATFDSWVADITHSHLLASSNTQILNKGIAASIPVSDASWMVNPGPNKLTVAH